MISLSASLNLTRAIARLWTKSRFGGRPEEMHVKISEIMFHDPIFSGKAISQIVAEIMGELQKKTTELKG